MCVNKVIIGGCCILAIKGNSICVTLRTGGTVAYQYHPQDLLHQVLYRHHNNSNSSITDGILHYQCAYITKEELL